MSRLMFGMVRRLHLALVLALFLSLLPLPALSPVALADDPPLIAPAGPDPITVDVPGDPHLPGLVLSVAVTPDPLAVGETATAVIIVTNEDDDPAENLVLTLPAPTEVAAQPGKGLVSAREGWRWDLGHLDGYGRTEVTATFALNAMPPGAALFLLPEATATGLPRSVRTVGGALVDPDAPATRPAPSAVPGKPKPGDDPHAAVVAYVPGREATLVSKDGRVHVTVPGDASDQPLVLSHTKQPAQGEKSAPTGSLQVRGLGVFYLGAEDPGKRTVHQFKAPLTVRVTYTDEQLRVRGLSAQALELFTFDEALDGGRWVSVPSTVDTTTREVVATVQHFSVFQIGQGMQPSANYLPNVADWQVSLFTGAATYSLPLDLPAGPGGSKPSLALSYNSQQMDGKNGTRPLGRAGWAGLGWTLEMPAIGLQRTYTDSVVYYSLSLNGVNTQLARGAALVGSPNLAIPTDWEWNSTDESYIRVRAVPAGTTDGTVTAPMTSGRSISTHQGARPRYYWKVRMPDNMVYEFAEDLWQGFNNCPGIESVDFEPYKWYLTKSTDRHGNTITYTYSRVDAAFGSKACGGGSSASGQGTMQIDARPTSITWGKNVNDGTTTERYKVEFQQSSRTDDNQPDCPPGPSGGPSDSPQFPDCTGVPRISGVLDGLWVSSKQASTWELQHGWTLVHDFSLKSDNTLSGTNQPDVYNRLTLKGIQRIGKNGGPGVSGATALPAVTFSYGTARGSNPDPNLSNYDWPNGNWNRLTSVNNNQGGTVSFTYQQIGQAVSKLIFRNFRRVTGKTVTDGRGNSYPWSYQYSSPMLNTLGASINPSDPNTTSAYPNSAALYLNYTWIPNSFGAVTGNLLTQANESFFGHAWAKEVRPDGSWSEHWFRQGDAGCTPTATGGGLTNYNNDSCFVLLRQREFERGKEYQVEQKTSGGGLLRRTESAFGVSFLDYTSPEIGVWRAWTFPVATYATVFENGGTPKVRTTNYAFDASYQEGGTQYGNLTRTAEYDGDYRVTGASTPRLRLTERWFNTLNDGSSNLLTTLAREEQLTGATGSDLLGRTRYFYDSKVQGGSATFGVDGTGNLKLVRSYATLGATPTQGVDSRYDYDAYGNRTQATTYAGYASETGNGPTFAAPGGGSAARTTTTVYDGTFHAFPTSVTPPDPNGVGLAEMAT